MRGEEIIKVVIERIKTELTKSKDVLEAELTPEQAERVGSVLTQATSAAWVTGFQTYLEAHDTQAPTIEVEGTIYRWKMLSSKEFLTPGGPMAMERSLYQPDSGGECYVPLDTAWGMVGQFATPEVREAVLFAVAQLTPREVEALLEKCASFHPSAAAIHAMTQEMGQWLEAHPELPAKIRAEEDVPEGTRVLVASLTVSVLRLPQLPSAIELTSTSQQCRVLAVFARFRLGFQDSSRNTQASIPARTTRSASRGVLC